MASRSIRLRLWYAPRAVSLVAILKRLNEKLQWLCQSSQYKPRFFADRKEANEYRAQVAQLRNDLRSWPQ